MITPAHACARPMLIGLSLLAFTTAPRAQECIGLPVTSGCTVNGGDLTTCSGTDGNDVIEGTFANDIIHGGGGQDIIDGGDGRDIICGGPGSDIIDGSVGADDLYGQGGNDTLLGSQEGDRMEGGTGDDTLSGGGTGFCCAPGTLALGGDGSDDLIGTPGPDTLVGGSQPAGGLDKCDSGDSPFFGGATDTILQCELVRDPF